MAKSEQQRQRQLAKKRAKEQKKKRAMSQQQQRMASLAGQMQSGSHGEICRCLASATGGEKGGMAQVMIARRLTPGRLASAFFLVDRWCLGVKNAGGRIVSDADLATMVERMNESAPLQSWSPACARKFVEDAIQYAARFGLAPHPDYRKASLIWGDIDPSECQEEFEFGQNGKPLYIAGPRDDQARQQLVLNKLTKAVGPDGFHYILPISDEMSHLNELPEFDPEEDFGPDEDLGPEDERNLRIDGPPPG